MITYYPAMSPARPPGCPPRSAARPILEAAVDEFAERGLHGTSTEEIARRAGHLAAVRLPPLRHEEGALHRVRRAAASARRSSCSRGRPRASAARRRSRRWARPTCELLHDRTRLLAQMQAYAAVRRRRDPRGRARGYGDLFAYVERVSGIADGRARAVLRQGDAAQRDGRRWTSDSRRAVGRAACVEGCKDR